MLESGASKPFFHLLQEYGFLSTLLPELSHFLKIRDDHLTLQLLAESDALIQKGIETSSDRALLLSALIFPLIDTFLKERSKGESKLPHLGQIESTILHIIDCVFTPFFQLPRRIRSMMVFILTSQYRFIPLDESPVRHPRLLNDTCTPLALALLDLRAKAQQELLPHYILWTETALQSHDTPLTDASDVGERRPKRRRYGRR